MNRLLALSIVALITSVFAQHDRLILATTTSTENSGLLATLLPDFERDFNIDVDVVAVGTGAALSLGIQGDADVLLVHAPAAEEALVQDGHAVNRRYVMYNDFVFVGPADDPADISSAPHVAGVMQRIKRQQVEFVSRGDDSGTHKKELALWQEANIKPDWDGYLDIGQGMGATLVLANERLAYTLTDRGTYLSTIDNLELVVLFEGDDSLFNPYHVMAVNPNKHDINYRAAMALIGYLTSPDVQARIAAYTINDQVLFFPAANTVPFD